MPIKLGVYDFFAFTIPGGIVTLAIIYILMKFGVVFNFAGITIVEFSLLTAISYLVGYVTDYISRKTWGLLFRQKNLFETTLAKFNERNVGIVVLPHQMDWYIPFSYIKKYNLDMAQEIDKLNVQGIMLKNSGFGLFLFAIIFAIDCVQNNYETVYGVASALCLIFSVVLMRESQKYARWFIESVCQTLVALIIEPEQLVDIKFPPKKTTRLSKKT